MIGIIVGIVVVVVLGVAAMLVLNADDGKVQFSKTAYDETKKTCHMDNAITTSGPNDSVYMIAAFHDTLDAGQSFTVTITKDGQAYGDPVTTSLPSKFNCYIEQGAMKPSETGVFKFTFTKDGKLEAEGTLTVK